MSTFGDVLLEIDRGRKGLNEGLPHGLERITQYIPNIQQKHYYLIGGATSVGKTTLADQMFVYAPYEYLQNNPECPYVIDIDYFSFEIDKVTKITKGISRKLLMDYQIKCDVNLILSRGKNRISQEIYDKVIQCTSYFERLDNVLHIWDIPNNPTGLYRYLANKLEANGKIIKKVIQAKSESGATVNKEIFDKYVPNNPNRYHIVITDHVSLLREERGYNTKQLIDKLDEYLVHLRNNFYITPVVVQQLNYDINSPERARIGRLSPMLSDFGDSKYTCRSADTVISLFSPMTFGLTKFDNYDISRLRDRYRSFEILKGRYGGLGVRVGLLFIGESGVFKELPKDITNKDYEDITKL